MASKPQRYMKRCSARRCIVVACKLQKYMCMLLLFNTKVPLFAIAINPQNNSLKPNANSRQKAEVLLTSSIVQAILFVLLQKAF